MTRKKLTIELRRNGIHPPDGGREKTAGAAVPTTREARNFSFEPFHLIYTNLLIVAARQQTSPPAVLPT